MRYCVLVPGFALVPVPEDFVVYEDSKPMPLTVNYLQRLDETRDRSFRRAEVILSPLAAFAYLLKPTFTAGGTDRAVAYGFRIVS